MYHFMIEAVPHPDNEDARGVAGAYVNCWVSLKKRGDAVALAHHSIEEASWTPGELIEESQVEASDYRDDPETLAYYREAEQDGACFVFNTWSADAEGESGTGDA